MSREGLIPGTAEQVQDLFLSSPGFGDFLEQLARLSAALLGESGSVDCTVTVVHRDGRSTVAGSSRQVQAMDEIQYAVDDGPCLQAVRTGMAVLIPDLAREHRWPEYLAAAAGCGYGCVLAVPLPVNGEDGAALNYYGRQAHAFGADAMVTAGGFAQIAAGALALAAGMERQARISEAMQAALDSRNTISRAVQILMDRHTCSQEAAFDMLRRAAVIRNVRMLEVAETVVAGTELFPGAPF
jgi:GAF domain-containing protein